MDSLGPESMFEDDKGFPFTSEGGGAAIGGYDDVYFDKQDEDAAKDALLAAPLSDEEKSWYPQVYEGGVEDISSRIQGDEHWEWWAGYNDKPTEWRVQIVSVITNSTKVRNVLYT
jgi:hypothetical protein